MISVLVVVVFVVGFGYGAMFGFVWRGLYDAWFRRFVNKHFSLWRNRRVTHSER